ncbi:ribonuclease domain-containing protein [Streptomyces sp. NBC_00358]|jgi:ribonuclease T1|uniref:ribonuclease domain-containing protein n=1 Tax=Streptomyces sp. NBC_00358 TaxID=2975725 RepID=UPI002E25BAB2
MLLRPSPRTFAGRLLAGLLVCLTVLLAGCSSTGTAAPGDSAATAASGGAAVPSWAGGLPVVPAAALPAEARATLVLIDRGGPFPYAKDGAVFGNFERELPGEANGYYQEYTVRTPGEGDRGARRIVTGRHGEIFYTDDHYNSFKAVLR